MENKTKTPSRGFGQIPNKVNLKPRPKLILIFLVVKVIPIILLTAIAFNQSLIAADFRRSSFVKRQGLYQNFRFDTAPFFFTPALFRREEAAVPR